MNKDQFAAWLGHAKEVNPKGDWRCVCWLLGERKTHRHTVCPNPDSPKSWRWFDHGTQWLTRDGKRICVGQPYQVSSDDLHELARLEALGCSVSVTNGGWYGYDTVTVIVEGGAA